MFSACLYNLWDWLDPASMENKKSSFQNNPNLAGNEPPFESIPKHQHNTAPQHLRLVQYGLKIPNHHHIIGNKSPLVSPNQHIHQPYQPQVHRNQPQYNMPNIHANPLHLHYNGQFPGNNNKQHQQQITQHQQQLQLQQNYQSNKQALASPAAQIWVPQKPPPHYHQKLRTEAPVSPSSSTTATTTTVATTPTHAKQLREIVDLKKKPTNQHLRSPSAKRSADAPVTMQGWLHKQGSDGLMLWKKRWFVLTEYCLFYYKGPEEEKLLGSILLPSYKVSLCSSDDKVNKKFAFKCEHANMRTYILAADTQELLLQWVRALNLACTLQTNIESESSIMNTSSSLHDQSMDNSDSGYNNHIRNTPVHLHTSSNATDLSNPSQEVSQYTQPLYANAPPKPRRLNDAGYSSPSPDDIDKYNEPKYVTLQPPPYQHNRYLVKSPMAIYNNLEYPSPIATNNNERRTPDTYGRSNIRPSNGRTISDYEDVYAEQYIYKRPLSPLAYNKTNALMMPMQRMHSAMPPDSQYTRRQSPVTIPRPHSADFLEYEVSHRKNNNSTPVNRQPRPKSSLDINRNCNSDNYFYSEERYAEKMRKSAQYLSKMPSKYLMQNRMEQQDNTFPITRSNTQPLGHNYMSSTEYARKDLPQLRSHNFLNEASLQKESNDSHYSSKYRDLVSPSQDLSFYNYNDKEYDPFTRSASARLASIEQRLQGDGRASMNKEGERKREESMKRLLEWKQRMLQSNLNRKMNQSSNKVYFKSDAGYGRSVDGNGRTTRLPSAQYNSYSSDDEASGSISLNLRDTYPRNASHNKWPSQQSLHSKSTSNLKRALDNDYLIKAEADYYMPRAPSHHDIAADNKRKQVLWKEKLNVSAGDLLGRTHEELVLLLIQLRRQSTNTAHAIEAYYNEIDSIQAQLHLMDAAKRLENLQKLEQIRQHLLDLEKQYEKGKPLVNLVDNMVKLGSLYSFPNEKHNYAATHLKDRLEFNQQMQEKRMLAEENRDWNRVKPNHSQLQEKVQQLYQLDRLIQEESDTLQGLQQDKEEIERALGGLRHKLMHGYNDPAIVEQARKQQSILENELSRVHLMLAQNSKKLEETVASNARLEQELLVLKQKLQVSRQNRFSPQISNAGDSLNCVVGTSAMMESDLQKVQQSVSDLQRQRQELSMQVRQLTDRSSLPQTKTFSPATMPLITIQQPQETKKKSSSQWRETDLDSTNKSEQIEGGECKLPTTPLYIQTDLKQGIDTNESYSRSVTSDSASEDTANGHSMFQPEKQEIKTVRIVKRESERRQRDRERNVPGKWDPLTEEDDYFPSNQNSSLYKTTPVVQKAQSSTNVNFAESEESLNRTVSSPSISNYEDDKVNKSPELSPVFKSEAARQIITEMSNQDAVSAKQQQLNRRLVPKEKRRHYTAPNNNLIMKSLNQLSTEDEDTFSKALRNTRRARDDMDMERALRQRMDAPDVVRSTLGSKELKYNESTIDNLLGTPNKISIPERYVPEQLPQLSAEEQEHRLRKVESIKKMLSDTAILSSSSANLAATEDTSSGEVSSSNNATGKVNSKIIEEKKQREHILQLNQILAKQVMEMSKIVAVNALSRLPLNDHHQSYSDDEDLSPETPLPLYQQRDNFYS